MDVEINSSAFESVFNPTQLDFFSTLDNCVEDNSYDKSEVKTNFRINCETKDKTFIPSDTQSTVNYNTNETVPQFNQNVTFGDSIHQSWGPTIKELTEEHLNEDKGYYTSSGTDTTGPVVYETCFDEQLKTLNKDFSKKKKINRKQSYLSPKKGSICQKKLAHATAEYRYRSSINDQIRRLKTLVAGPNAKWKKSAILETVADYIQKLKAANHNLVEENLQLKMRLSHETSNQLNVNPMNTSYLFLPTFSSLTNSSQLSTIMYSCI